MIWVAARAAIIRGVVTKKPIVVPRQTAAATLGEINIAKKIATCAPKVKDIGPIITFGITIGTTKPIVHNTPARTS